MLILITGGSGSGKSEYAEEVAVTLKTEKKAEKLYYMAAMKPYGEEGAARVEKHRRQREGKGFETVEHYTSAPIEVEKNGVMLLECLSNLAANEVFDEKNKNAADDICDFIFTAEKKLAALVVVTNDIFSDGLLYGSETIAYMEVLGEINRRAAERADSFYEVVCGIPVRLK